MDEEKNEVNYTELPEEELENEDKDQTSYCLILFAMYAILLVFSVFLIFIANLALNHSLDDLISYSPDDIRLLFYFGTVIIAHDSFIFACVLIVVYVCRNLKIINFYEESQSYSLLLYLWLSLLTCTLIALCYWIGQLISTGQYFVSPF